MERRPDNNARWVKWGTLVILAAVGCGDDWERALSELQGRSDNGGAPPGPPSADADAGAGEALDASESADATQSADATAATDAAAVDTAATTDTGADGESTCATGSTACGPNCCPADFVCIENNACSPVCSGDAPLCGGACCPHATLCIDNVCSIGCSGGVCPDGGACAPGSSCGPAGTIAPL